jgi:CysZ protein
MSIAVGVGAFKEALTLSRHPRLRRFFWAPAAVSFVIIVATASLLFSYVDDLVVWMMSFVPDWLSFLDVILAPLIYIVGVLLAAWFFGYFATIVASPFLGVLAAHVEELVTGTAPQATLSLGAMALMTFKREARKLLYHLPRLLIVLVITLIPGVNALSPFVWFFFGAWMMAVQFADFAAENEERPFTDTLAILKANRAASLGFGAPTALAMGIPVVNFLVIPFAVTGATVLWCRIKQQDPLR